MATITIEVTDTQYKGLQYAALDPQEWVENVATSRAKASNDVISQIVIDYCLENDIQIPATRDAIISYGFDNGLVQTMADRDAASAE